MEATSRRIRGRRRAAPGAFIACALLLALPFAGCGQEQAVDAPGPEKTAEPSASAEAPEAAAAVPGEPAPRVRFEEPDYDFGEVEAGEEVEHTFVFENAGDSPLSVSKVVTRCGCTATASSDEEIPPGGTGGIQATLETRGFDGALKKDLIVETNDPERPVVRLTISGRVISEVTVEPGYLNWESLQPGERPRARKLTIRFAEGRELRLERVHAESPALILKKESEDGRKAVYSVALAEDLPEGRFAGRITIRSNSERLPEIHVPFQGRVQGTVKVLPPILSLGRVRSGESLTRRLSVSKTAKQDFTIEKVKATTGAISTEIHEEKEGARYEIEVTYTPGPDVHGPVAERVTIFVNDGRERLLEVPLYGTVEGEEPPADGRLDG